MNHIICPICQHFTDESTHNKITCNELHDGSQVSHKFDYYDDGQFNIILILKKKHVIMVGSNIYEGTFGLRVNKTCEMLTPFDHCDALSVMNKVLKNKSFI